MSERILTPIIDLVEKPTPDEAPSRLAIAARYVFSPAIYEVLEGTQPGKGGEVQLTDAIRTLNFLFLGGAPPAAPHPECGSDTTDDSLTCEAYPPCN